MGLVGWMRRLRVPVGSDAACTGVKQGNRIIDRTKCIQLQYSYMRDMQSW